MDAICRLLLLILLAAPALAADNRIAPGQILEDFSWPSAIPGKMGQRLAEQRGRPLMLIWTGRCDQCDEVLARYQMLAESHRHDSLESWVIWTPHKNDQPPQLRIPVLSADPHWLTGWQFEPRPAVMMINPDGRLDYLITGRLPDNYTQTEQTLSAWLAGQRP